MWEEYLRDTGNLPDTDDVEFIEHHLDYISYSDLSFGDKMGLQALITEQYDELLDSEGPVKIAGLLYDVSRALKQVDEIAYRQGLLDYVDSLITDGELPDDVEV